MINFYCKYSKLINLSYIILIIIYITISYITVDYNLLCIYALLYWYMVHKWYVVSWLYLQILQVEHVLNNLPVQYCSSRNFRGLIKMHKNQLTNQNVEVKPAHDQYYTIISYEISQVNILGCNIWDL